MKNKKQIIELLKDVRAVTLDIEQEFNFGEIRKAQEKRKYWEVKFKALYPKLLGGTLPKFSLRFIEFGGFELSDLHNDGKVVSFDNI